MEEGERILVEGITLRTTKYDLMRYFRKWGPLAESFVNIHEETGRSRGFGFISFFMKLHSDLCLESDSHIIDNVKVVLRRLNSAKPKRIIEEIKAKRILVSFIGCDLRRRDLIEYFSKFGSFSVQSKEKEIRQHHFAYITFDDEDTCRKCLAIGYHCIKGQQIFIRKVIRREELKKAEQIERERAARAERSKNDHQIERPNVSMRLLATKTSLPQSLLNPPPPPSHPPPPSRPLSHSLTLAYHSPVDPNRSCWVPLLPANCAGQLDDASVIAGYGPSKDGVNIEESSYCNEYCAKQLHFDEMQCQSDMQHFSIPVTQFSSAPYYYSYR